MKRATRVTPSEFLILNSEFQPKDRLSRPAVHRHRAAETFDNRLHDRQPESAATAALADRTRRVGLEEAIEDMRQVFRRDAGAFISHREDHGAAVALRSQRDGRTGRRVAERVGGEVLQRLFEPIAIAADVARRSARYQCGSSRRFRSPLVRGGRRRVRITRRSRPPRG